ncbi:unnamed protein product, partial [Meganyctiphanes norvegica]
MLKIVRLPVLSSFHKTNNLSFANRRCGRCIFSLTGEWKEKELTNPLKKDIEEYWRKQFKLTDINNTKRKDIVRKKKYILSMFPYPSGKLHMGHVRVYTISDAMARYYDMKGYQVVHPMGWDAFGLPAENAAIEHNEKPDTWTYRNIAHMRKQLLSLGCNFDWDREFATCDSEYYKWTQYLFLKLFKAGLAYQEEAKVNWDPVDQTVLADEQVDENGCSWRSGAKVEKKFLKQWFIKTTRFSESLLSGLEDENLEDWREIAKMQSHWIGECNGYRIEMDTINDKTSGNTTQLSVWMAQPEFLANIYFLGINSEHCLAKEHLLAEKHGRYQLLTIKAVNPLTGEKIPIIKCDDLKFIEGTDFYVGIPVNNEDDEKVALKCGLKLSTDRENNAEPREKVLDICRKQGNGGYLASAKLRDWLISRQRYWGTPIPIIHCNSCGSVPVPEEQLPVELPVIQQFHNKGGTPLADALDWVHCKCPSCGGDARRETDTMDTFVDSSWYFLRFLDPKNQLLPFDFSEEAKLMPVDLYIGGKEHAVLHMYYARFMQHFLQSIGLASCREPFKRLLVQGMVMGQSFRSKESGKYLRREEIDFSVDPPVEKDNGSELITTFEKMSKSKYNGIDPQEVLDEYGTDTTRLLMLANFAPRSNRSWSNDTFPGIVNWQNRMWLTVSEFIDVRNSGSTSKTISPVEWDQHVAELVEKRNFYVRGATYNIEKALQLSTAISYMQGLTSVIRKVPASLMLSQEYEDALCSLIIMLAPIMPHLASELWVGVASVSNTITDPAVLNQPWPQPDPHYKIKLNVKINTAVRNEIELPCSTINDMDISKALQVAQEHDKSQVLEKCNIVETHFELLQGLEATIQFVVDGPVPPVEEMHAKNKKNDRKKKKTPQKKNS